MTRKQEVASLLKRYEFIDFAKVVAVSPDRRKEYLRIYIDRDPKGRWPSYKGLRMLTPDIAGVVRGLDPTSIPDLPTILRGLRDVCHPDDYDLNVEAASVFFGFVRGLDLDAYSDHPKGSLRIGPDRTIQMGVEHYVVDRDRGIFRYVYPRRDRLLGHIPAILLSLIHHNFVQGDYDQFEVEMIDLSCEERVGPRGGISFARVRSPRVVPLDVRELWSRERLNNEANHIYGLLMEIADEE